MRLKYFILEQVEAFSFLAASALLFLYWGGVCVLKLLNEVV